MLKRDNWTNDEVIQFVQGLMIDAPGWEQRNEGLQDIVEEFQAFKVDEKVFGAMAYDTEMNEIVHIGEIPGEFTMEDDIDDLKLYDAHTTKSCNCGCSKLEAHN